MKRSGNSSRAFNGIPQRPPFTQKINCIQGKPVQAANEIAPFTLIGTETRTMSGLGNNMHAPQMGMQNALLARQSQVAYADGHDALALRYPGPREISNSIHFQNSESENSAGLTDIFWLWGQMIDHDLGLTPNNSGEFANISTPPDDKFLPNGIISFQRSAYTHDSQGIRQHPNINSSFMDGSVVHSSDEPRAVALRAMDGTGRLKVVKGKTGEDLLIKNTYGLPNGKNPPSAPDTDFFLAGDERVNENVLLTGIQTIFVREHNYWCQRIQTWKPEYVGQDEPVYQQSRRIVNALIQAITFNEFLPKLLGPLPPYQGYNPDVDPTIRSEFSTVAFRIGHTMLSSTLNTNAQGTEKAKLRDLFFNPKYVDEHGIEGVIVGAMKKKMQEIDCRIIDDVRNFLFQTPSGGIMNDLVSLNLQRARDHGIPDYNTVRVAYGLAPKTTFEEITSDPDTLQRLKNTYQTVDGMEPWSVGLCEDHVPGAQVGELFRTIILDQFMLLRGCDRFWFENDPALSDGLKSEIRNTRLSDIIKRNLQVTDPSLVPRDAFRIQ